MADNLDKSDVFGRFYKFDLRIRPDAVEEILEFDDQYKLINTIINNHDEKDEFVEVEEVKEYKNALEEEKLESTRLLGREPETEYENDLKRTIIEEPESIKPRDQPGQNYQVLKDIGQSSDSEAGYKTYRKMFKDRYDKLKKIGDKYGGILPAGQVYRKKDEKVTTGGLVIDQYTSRNDNPMIKVMDKDGNTTTLVVWEGEALEQVEKIVPHEFIIVEGKVSEDKGKYVFVDKLHFPDIPMMNSPNTADRGVEAAFISDTHFGAKLFREDKWKDFVNWVRQREKLEYILIAGDLVEGIGIYPNQIEELSISDIYKQYKLCAESFKQLPKDVTIICCMGNHDRVRLAEPQLKPEDKILDMFDENVVMTGNPSLVEIEGVKVQFYHGMSLNQVADKIPGQEVESPHEPMRELLIKRHLAPEFGGNTRLAPEDEDYLVIEEVPDVLHSGHVHMVGKTVYNGVRIINTGCWIGQTAYQAQKNIDPDVGYAYVSDLSKLNMELVEF